MMIAVPITFLTAVLFSLLALSLCMLRQCYLIRWTLIIFTFASALMSWLVALRWQTDWQAVRMFMPVLASMLPPLAFFCFYPPNKFRPVLPHFVVTGVALLLALFFPVVHVDPDFLVVVSFMGYGSYLIAKGLRVSEFTWSKFSQIRETSTMALIMGAWLWMNALIDLAVAWDFLTNNGQHAANIVGYAHVSLLVLFVFLAVSIVRLQMPVHKMVEMTPEKKHFDESLYSENQSIVTALSHWLIDELGYQNPDLSLDKMARKMGIPSRKISIAINQVTDQSVSLWVNTIRIDQAKEKLTETEQTVTEIMFDCGYLTKSNFNKAFKRQTGMSPSQYRQQATD